MSAVPCVIIHADAFGRHPSLNEGVERAYRYGLVTSASVMAVGGALEDAVCRAREMPYLDLGLHFALWDSSSRPLDFRQVSRLWLRGEFPVREMAGQLRQQLDLLTARSPPLALAHHHAPARPRLPAGDARRLRHRPGVRHPRRALPL